MGDFVTAESVCESVASLNVLFLASMFAQETGLVLTSNQEEQVAKITISDVDGSREERVFLLWIMSLGIERGVNDLDEDLRDGLALLQIEESISPGIVDWSKVNTAKLNAFKKVENCNYGVSIAREMGCVVVGIDGQDVARGNRKLTLAIMWQLMRHNVLEIIKNLTMGGREVSDDDIVAWANGKVAESGKGTSIKNFKDKSISSGLFLIDLLAAIRPRSVDYAMVTEGEEEEDALLNAKYAIGTARKVGAQRIFLVPEDIVEVRSKLVMVFVASLMNV